MPISRKQFILHCKKIDFSELKWQLSRSGHSDIKKIDLTATAVCSVALMCPRSTLSQLILRRSDRVKYDVYESELCTKSRKVRRTQKLQSDCGPASRLSIYDLIL